MTFLSALLLALFGTLAAGAGGFLLGRVRRPKEESRDGQVQLETTLEKVLAHLDGGSESVARAVDPLAEGGRDALHDILERIREHSGFTAVVLSDDAGLTVAGVGTPPQTEMMAVSAASFGSAADRIAGRHRALLEVHPDQRWTIHRYFDVEGAELCISATRQGSFPRVDALDGATGALERVLRSTEGSRSAVEAAAISA